MGEGRGEGSGKWMAATLDFVVEANTMNYNAVIKACAEARMWPKPSIEYP